MSWKKVFCFYFYFFSKHILSAKVLSHFYLILLNVQVCYLRACNANVHARFCFIFFFSVRLNCAMPIFVRIFRPLNGILDYLCSIFLKTWSVVWLSQKKMYFSLTTICPNLYGRAGLHLMFRRNESVSITPTLIVLWLCNLISYFLCDHEDVYVGLMYIVDHC